MQRYDSYKDCGVKWLSEIANCGNAGAKIEIELLSSYLNCSPTASDLQLAENKMLIGIGRFCGRNAQTIG